MHEMTDTRKCSLAKRRNKKKKRVPFFKSKQHIHAKSLLEVQKRRVCEISATLTFIDVLHDTRTSANHTIRVAMHVRNDFCHVQSENQKSQNTHLRFLQLGFSDSKKQCIRLVT